MTEDLCAHEQGLRDTGDLLDGGQVHTCPLYAC